MKRYRVWSKEELRRSVYGTRGGASIPGYIEWASDNCGHRFIGLAYELIHFGVGEIMGEHGNWLWVAEYGDEKPQKEYKRYPRNPDLPEDVRTLPGLFEWAVTSSNAHWPSDGPLYKFIKERKGEISGRLDDWIYEVVFDGK